MPLGKYVAVVRGSKYKKPKSKKAKVSKPVKMAIKKAINQNEETKTIQFSQTGNLFNPQADFANFYAVTGDLICLSPHGSFCAISQGTGVNARIGNQIKVVSSKLKICMWPYGYDASYNPTPTPIYIKMWVFKTRYNNSTTDVQSNIFNAMLDSNASSTGLTGTLADITKPINKDIFTLVKTQIFKLGCASADGTGSVANAQYQTNNDFKLAINYSLDISKHVNKIYHYNDNTTTPYDGLTWALFEPIFYDNSNPINNYRPGKYYYTLEIKFKDA